MASRKRSRKSLPPQQSGQQTILNYFTKKNVSEGRNVESSQTSTSTSAGTSGTTKITKISSKEKLSTQTDTAPKCDGSLIYFGKLPEEIKMMIFCQLPKADLMNCALVCREWHRIIKLIISSESFIPWKKGYLLDQKGLLDVDYKSRSAACYNCKKDWTISSRQLTNEQEQIVAQEVKGGELMKIMAFAGTGKTTTLVEYTEKRPEKKFLNVAYNKSIQKHAEKTFPKNVKSRTIHSLAFESVGKRYKSKLTFNLRVRSIMNSLPEDEGYFYAKRVQNTLNNFIASADETVELAHVPVVTLEDLSEDRTDQQNADLFRSLNSTKTKQRVISHTASLWERMKDESDKEFKITHDGYLKLYQLNKPVLAEYDFILVDEAQDCTPTASDILLRQTCAKILVGDPHQQIYAFRGARNALQEVQSTHTLYLTHSFRFGPEIATAASTLLNKLKGAQDHNLVGVAKKGAGKPEDTQQLCVITRSNCVLFDEAAKVCCEDNNIKVGFVGGLKGLALDLVLEIHHFYKKGHTSHSFLKNFQSFSEFKKFAKEAQEVELLSKIKIAEKHESSLENEVEQIKSKVVSNYHKADIIFTTAHKAKGLEFDRVRLTDDFLPRTQRDEEEEEKEDDKNLAYVAVTRAKRYLELSKTIFKTIGGQSYHIGEY